MVKQKNLIDEIHNEYKKERQEILYKMYQLVLREQKKTDNKEYSELLKKLKNG